MSVKKCPYCGGDLEEGKLMGRGGTFFLPDGQSVPLTYSKKAMAKRGAVLLPPEYYSLEAPEWPAAYVCRGCKMMVIPFE